ncbi:MAG TPA: HDIG domain-containing protein, partial [Gemmataceae bacterium]|nr:HDIG domain-containing protein [Gemmataceae bacterium]
QWNGRRRSSRSEEAVLPRLWQGTVLLRLAPVLATALAVTYLAYWGGPPLSYRVGEIYPRDLRVRVYFEVIDQQKTDAARDAAIDRLPAAQIDNPVAREEARRAVQPVCEKFPVGMLLVPRGETITERQLTLLEEEHRAFLRSLRQGDHVRRGVALFLVMSLLAALVVLYVARFQGGLAQSLPKITAVCLLVVITVGFGLLLSRPPWYAVLIPLTVTAMILTIAYNPQFALLMSFSLALATTVALGHNLNRLLVQIGGLATAVLLLRNVRTRTRLVEVAAGAGMAYLAMTVATELLSGQTWSTIAFDAGRHFAWGTLAGFLLSGCLPLVERAFGIITDVSLLELADGSHPLLQELIRRAPGTYTHSMTVATLAEAAAEAVGANPLLTRVGSYFHDIGKMLKPHYFIENQAGENRHDDLEPALSTLIIIGHVKDGVALARQYNLPRPVIDFIQQHHGTTLVEYFYHEAIRMQQGNSQGHAELEASFRYPGPKPQNRENGIVMLADAVESTSRALSEPTPNSLRKLVHDLLMKRLLDAQFEESGLTLTELHLIEEQLCKSLIALYHARIKYPEKARGEAS